MCIGVNLKDLHNDTLDEIYSFYFEPDNSTGYEISESHKLSNITFVIVIIVLMSFMAILYTVFRIVTKGQDLSIDDAILIDRVQRLRNEMNPSLLRTPDDPNSEYQMKNNKPPNNTSMSQDPVYDEDAIAMAPF